MTAKKKAIDSLTSEADSYTIESSDNINGSSNVDTSDHQPEKPYEASVKHVVNKGQKTAPTYGKGDGASCKVTEKESKIKHK